MSTIYGPYSKYNTALPIHSTFTAVGSSTTHTNFINYYGTSTQGYQNFTNIGSSSTHTNFKLSGYDSPAVATTINPAINETLPIQDSMFFGLFATPDHDQLPIQDTTVVTYNINMVYTTRINISGWVSDPYSTTINIMASSVNSVTDLFNTSNVFTPTIILDGSYYVQNAATDPGGNISTINRYFQLNQVGPISNNNLCQVIDYNLNLNFSGGEYNIRTLNDPTMGTTGQNVVVFGLVAQAIYKGQFAGNRGVGYETRGILGSSVQLNRNLPLIEINPNLVSALQAVSPSAISFPSRINKLFSAGAFATAIAKAVGIKFQWLVQDFYLLDTYPTSAFTPLQAIDFLASKIGGVLIWDGVDTYVVAYLDKGHGYWTPPDCRLMGPEGITSVNIPDIVSQTYFQPFKTIVVGGDVIDLDPSYASNATDEVPQVDSLGRPLENVTRVASYSQPATDGISPYLVNLDGDWKTIKFQLVSQDPATITAWTNGGESTQPYYNISVGTTYVTQNGTTSPGPGYTPWTTVCTRPNLNEFVSIDITGKQYINIPQSAFPATGSYTFNVGVTRDTDADKATIAYAKETAAAIQSLIDTGQQAVYYVPIQTGTVQYYFTGSLPLPGMMTSITNAGITLSGIIESVSLASPGFMNITISSYKRVEIMAAFKGVILIG